MWGLQPSGYKDFYKIVQPKLGVLKAEETSGCNRHFTLQRVAKSGGSSLRATKVAGGYHSHVHR
jgi:hypothetical protein